MSRKSSFTNLCTHTAPPASAEAKPDAAPARAQSREGRKQIAGFFTPEMSFAMHMLAPRQGRSLQSLMAEASDDVLRKRGETLVRE